MYEAAILTIILLLCLAWAAGYFYRILKKPERNEKPPCCSTCDKECIENSRE